MKEKVYCELLLSLSMLFVHIFVHTRECDRSTQIGVEHIKIRILNYPFEPMTLLDHIFANSNRIKPVSLLEEFT